MAKGRPKNPDDPDYARFVESFTDRALDKFNKINDRQVVSLIKRVVKAEVKAWLPHKKEMKAEDLYGVIKNKQQISLLRILKKEKEDLEMHLMLVLEKPLLLLQHV